MGERLSFARLFRALNASGTRYVVVGGLAVVLHGHQRLTADTDLVVDLAAGPASRLLEALRQLGFVARAPVDLMEFADPQKRRAWIENKHMQVFSLYHPDEPGRVVDLFAEHPMDFEGMVDRAVTKLIEGIEVPVASIDDLIELKRRAGRDIDLDDIQRLEQIRDIQGEYRV